MRIFISVLIVGVAFGQSDSTVKYFSTSIMRTNILKGKPEKSVDKKEAHFRAVYYPSGELKSIEFLPANWDKRKRKKSGSVSRLKLYYLKWNPKKQELLEGLTKTKANGIPHYRATMNEAGLVKNVDYINRYGKMLWTFHLRWDDYGKSNEYDIEFYSNKNLSVLNQELFAPDLSTIRPGWIARYKINNTGIPKTVTVMDQLENIYYYYEFNYGKNVLKSKYFRSDSILVGSHTVQFNQQKKPTKIIYFNENEVMKNAIGYEYPNDAKVIISQINNKGKVIERRIIPKKETK